MAESSSIAPAHAPDDVAAGPPDGRGLERWLFAEMVHRSPLPWLALLCVVPFVFVSIPPLLDVPAHYARFFIELNIGHLPALARNWSFKWKLIGDLGVDLIIVPLSAVLGLQRALWLVCAVIPMIFIVGLGRLSIAAHGRISPYVYLALPIAMAQPFLWGFLNYWLSCGLAFLAYSAWVGASARGWKPWAMALLCGGLAFGLWITHAYGWLVFLVLVFAFELKRQGVALLSRPISAVAGIGWRTWLGAIPLLPMLLGHGGGLGAHGFFLFGVKTQFLLLAFNDQNQLFDLATLIAVVMGGVCALAALDAAEAREVRIAFGLILLLIIGLPADMLGSFFADSRLIVIALALALCSAIPKDLRSVLARSVTMIGIVLFVARIAIMATGFVRYDAEYRQHLRALDAAPMGANIAVITPMGCNGGWRDPRVGHLDSIAVVTKQAFVNSQFAIPGGQLLQPIHDRGGRFNADPSQIVGIPGKCADTEFAVLAPVVAAVPRDRFDYLWIVGGSTAALKPFPGLRRLYADESSSFYAFTPAEAR